MVLYEHGAHIQSVQFPEVRNTNSPIQSHNLAALNVLRGLHFVFAYGNPTDTHSEIRQSIPFLFLLARDADSIEGSLGA
jgi:hypothetical protein